MEVDLVHRPEYPCPPADGPRPEPGAARACCARWRRRPSAIWIPPYLAVMDETAALARYVFQTQNPFTLDPARTPAAQAWKLRCTTSSRKAIRCWSASPGSSASGSWRWSTRARGDLRRVDAPWGQVITPGQVEEALKERPAKLVAIVHGETSTGVAQPLHEIAEIVHRHGASAAGRHGRVARRRVGARRRDRHRHLLHRLAEVPERAARPRADHGRARGRKRRWASGKSKVQSWYLDLTLLRKYWGPERVYHHTGPANMIFAMREALRIVHEEGLEARFARHAACARDAVRRAGGDGHEHARRARAAAGEPDDGLRAGGVDEMAVRKQLLTDYNIEIAGGLGVFKGTCWRVGLMGYSARPENVVTLLGASGTGDLERDVDSVS